MVHIFQLDDLLELCATRIEGLAILSRMHKDLVATTPEVIAVRVAVSQHHFRHVLHRFCCIEPYLNLRGCNYGPLTEDLNRFSCYPPFIRILVSSQANPLFMIRTYRRDTATRLNGTKLLEKRNGVVVLMTLIHIELPIYSSEYSLPHHVWLKAILPPIPSYNHTRMYCLIQR